MNRSLAIHTILLATCVVWVGACGDDDTTPMHSVDSGIDAPLSVPDAGPAPTCGAQQCGSPVVGAHCCTETADVTAGLADATSRCGTDLAAIVTGLANTCVELRRSGTRDDQCPPRAVGTALELGCCTAAGVCGTLNVAADLGCQRALLSEEPVVACGFVASDSGVSADAD